MSDIDDFLGQRRTGAVEQTGAPDIDGFFQERRQQQAEQQQAQVRQSLEFAVKDDPEVAAARRRVSESSGLPLNVVERNLTELKAKEAARAFDLAQMSRKSPVLFRQLSDPQFAAESVDDIFTLGNLEQALVNAGRYTVGAPGTDSSLAGDLGGAAKDIGLGGTVGVGKMVFDLAAMVNDTIGWKSGAEGMRAASQRAKESMEFFGSQGQSSTAQALRSGFQSAGQNLALAPLGLERGLFQTAEAAGSAVAGVMAAGVGADAFNESRRKGNSLGEAYRYAIPQAGFEFLFEKMPASKLFGDIASNAGLMKTLRNQAISEGWTEQLTTVAQDFNEWVNLHPEKSLGDFIAERPEAAYQTFIATLVGVGVQTSTIHGINKAVEKMTDQRLQFDLDNLQQQMALASQSVLRERSPDQFRAHVQQVMDSDDGTKKAVYIDGQALAQLPQDVFNQLPQAVRDAVPEAAASSAPVALSMADVLTIAPGTPLEQVVNDNARMTPDALSRVEAQQAGEQAQEFIKSEAERVLKDAQDQQAWASSSENVKNTIWTQLDQAGRFSHDVNEAYATLQMHFFSTTAARWGVTPEELYNRYSLKAAGQQGQGGAILDQGTSAEVDDALDALTGDELEDDQVFSRPLPPADDESLGYVAKVGASPVGTGGIHLSVRGGEVREAGPHEFYFHDNDDTPVGFARLTKNAKQASINMIAFTEDARGNGYGKAFYKYLLDDLGLEVKSDKEITEGTAAMYRSLAAEYPVRVDTDGRIVISPKGALNQSPAFDGSETGNTPTLDDVRQQWTNAGIKHSLSESRGRIALSLIVVPEGERDTGKGTAALQSLVDYADRTGQRVELTPSSDFGGNKKRLVAFYKRFGFVENKGRNKDFEISESMYRAPQTLNQEARGTFNPQTLLISLNENADLSTFLHESGHFFLEVMADMASRPDAPQQIRDDMAAVLKWFDVADLATWNAMTLDQKRKYHERWAESFEQYLFEGKAPNAELQPLFRRFRSWLVNVYKSLTQFMRSRDLKVSDEIRKVFDRLIATDAQIAQAEEAAGLLPDFDATNEAIEKMNARSLRAFKWGTNARSKYIKALQKQAAELRKGVESEVRAEVAQTPEMQAKAALDALRKSTPEYKAALAEWNTRRQSELDKAEEDVKNNLLATEGAGLKGLDKGQFLAKNKRRIANEAEARALEWERGNPKPARTLVGTDADVATIADSFGFESVEKMLQAINEFGNPKDAIEAMTDQRMLERHGDLSSPEAIADAANQAVHNEARAKALAAELKSQAEALNPRQDTGRTNTKGSKITVNAITEAAKQFALNLAARRRVKDLRNAAHLHRAAEARAGKAWQEATAAGKTQDAVQAKRDQVLNNYTVKALQDAQAEAKKILEFFKRVTKDSDEKTVTKGRDPDVVNAMRAVLAAYDVAPRLEKSATEYLALVEKNDPAMYGALKPAVDTAIADAKPITEMTMEELRGLHDELQAMWHLAKRSRQMEVDGNLMDMQDAEDELQARMQEIGVPSQVPGESGALTAREELARKLQFAGSLLRRAEQWAEGMGKPFTRLVFQPVKQAANAYRTDRVKYRKAYQELVDAVAPSLHKGLIEAPELGYTFGRGHNGIGHAELLHAILHTGNESNKRKLLLGRNWASENADGTLDTSRWDAFLKRMHDTGTLGKAHYDFAQGVWDLLEQTKPLAQKTHRDVFGRYFAEVTADAFETPFGSYRGGYVPAQADPRIVQDADLRKLAESENENMAFSFPATSKGFTKARVEYNRPLLLDLRTIGQHIDKVLLFAHMEPAVRDVQKLLSRKGVSYSLGRIDPTVYAGMLTPWLNRSARQVVETPVVGDGGISRVLSAARGRAGLALMFGNVSNAVQQLSGFSSAFAKLKADGLESHMMRATAEFISGPKAMSKTVADASEFMAGRMDNEISAINDAMDAILLDPNLYQKAQAWTSKHAYFLQTAMANTMEPIIWTAGYNAALEKTGDEKAAVQYADSLIRQTQGSTLPEDVSRIETGPAYARMFTQFIGYFNMMANTNATALKQIAQETGLKKGAGKALAVVTMGMLVPLWIAEAIAQAMKGGPDDKDKDGYLDDWLAAVLGMGTIKGSLAMVPFIGQLANAGINRFNSNPADDRVSMSPAVSLLEGAVAVPYDVYKAITDKANKRTMVRDVASLVSIATGLPAVAVARPLGYLAGVADDTINPTGPADAVRGTVTGTASPASK